MTKAAAAKTWTLNAWGDGSFRSYPEPSGPIGLLADAANGLAPGEWVDFATGAQTGWTQADWEWQTCGFWDPIHNLVHVMGKPVGNTAWAHRWYALVSNTWNTGLSGGWNNSGHVYGNSAIDPSTGDLYCVRGGLDGAGGSVENPERARWWKYSLQDWSSLSPTTQDIYPGGALVSMGNGLSYHPNLYGVGVGGWVLSTSFRTCFWRKDTDAVADVSHAEDRYGNREGVGCYFPANDSSYVGGADGNLLLKVTPHATPGSAPVLTEMSSPPISLRGNSDAGAGGFGSLHVHPANSTKLIIVERGNSTTSTYRWWTSTDGDTWSLGSGNHPFSFRPYVVISIPELGVLWALGENDVPTPTFYSRVWKPAA